MVLTTYLKISFEAIGMAIQFLSPNLLPDGNILILKTKRSLSAWIQSHSFNRGKSKVFVRSDIPENSELVFEKFDLWLLEGSHRRRIRLYDFPCNTNRHPNTNDGHEVLLTMLSAISAGSMQIMDCLGCYFLEAHKPKRTITIPIANANIMLARCDLLPASSKEGAEFKALELMPGGSV